jgi:alpha-D-ribose 1-methylphosphonate 5-triphosphate synthase subunit PhnL
VHQHFELVDRLRVWENVVLGREPRRGLRLDAAARERVRMLAASYALDVDPDAVVENLPVGIAQRVEILRELAREPTALVLDEPTAVLAPGEIDALFATLRDARRARRRDLGHHPQAGRGDRARRPRDRHAGGPSRHAFARPPRLRSKRSLARWSAAKFPALRRAAASLRGRRSPRAP